MTLPRAFRRAGLRTDVFDAGDLASCRMYGGTMEVLRGLAKNATEGLAAPGTLGPATVLLFGGQVLPFLLLAAGWARDSGSWLWLLGAATGALIHRLIAAARFRQSVLGALLHPLGVAALLGIQWNALIRRWRGRPVQWRKRSYGPEEEAPTSPPQPLQRPLRPTG